MKRLSFLSLIVLAILQATGAVAQTRSEQPYRVSIIMDLVRMVTPASHTRELADALLLDYVRALDPKDANEGLIDDLIFLLKDEAFRDIAARCLQHLDRLPMARKAIPTLLMLLPEETCLGVAGGTHWSRLGPPAAKSIRQVLTDMKVDGRDWTSVERRCDLFPSK